MGSNLEISASEADIQHILKKSYRFTVPDYQRLYSWKEAQWTEFWNDLNNISDEDTHFLGSIVVIQYRKSIDELDEMEVVDGQQRLTTISLLLRAMQQYYEDLGEQIAEQIRETYLHEADFDINEYPKLELSRFDNDRYQEIIDGDPTNVPEEEQLRKAYDFFAEKIEGLEKSEVDQLRKHLLGSMTLVVVECDSAGSAFRLFETLNNRGLELSAVDLMKNALLQVASEKYPGGDESEEYEQIRDQWEKVLEKVVHEISEPDRFFRHYIMSRPVPDINGSVTSRQLYETFRDIIEERLPTEGVTLVDYVDGMVDHADLYVGLTDANVDEFSSRPQKKINRRIRNLNDIQASHARTILLRAFDEFEEYEDILSLLRLLEVFMIRWRVAGNQTGANLDKVFSELCSDAFDDSDPLKTIRLRLAEEAPSDNEFRSRLTNSDFSRNAQTKYMLDTIERQYYMQSGEGKEYDRATVDLEHIAPQRTYSAKKYSPWRDVISVGEAKFDHYRNRLGNLTLLEERLNESASDNPFQQKKDQYKLSDFEMTQAVREEYDKWSIDQIEHRSEKLAEIGVEIWDFDRFK